MINYSALILLMLADFSNQDLFSDLVHRKIMGVLINHRHFFSNRKYLGAEIIRYVTHNYF